MYNVVFIAIFFFSIFHCVTPLEIVDVTRQNRQVTLQGAYDVKFSIWELVFDEDLYYIDAPKCSGGGCQPQFQTTDQCWPGCDYSLQGDQCGLPAAPGCECDPAKAGWCDPGYEWTTLELDVPTGLVEGRQAQYQWYRFHWTSLCDGFELQIYQESGFSQAYISRDRPDPHTQLNCAQTAIPDKYLTVCPSRQCYGYGTWNVRVETFYDNSVYSLTLKRVSVADEPVTQLPPDAPLDLCDPSSLLPFYQCVPLGIPIDVFLPSDVQALFYQLTTSYCGRVIPILEIVSHPVFPGFLEVEQGFVIVSTDPMAPYPSDVFTETTYFENYRPVYICPTAEVPVAIAYFTLGRVYTAGLGDTTMRFTIEYERDDFPFSYTPLGSLTADSLPDDPRIGSVYAQGGSAPQRPPLKDYNAALTAGAVQMVCPISGSDTPVLPICKPGTWIFTGCRDQYFTYNSEFAPEPLVPEPQTLVTISATAFSENLVFGLGTSPRPNVLGIVHLHEIRQSGQVVATANFDPNWESWVDDCYLTFPTSLISPLGAFDGSWLSGDEAEVRLAPDIEPECDADAFARIVERIDQFTSDMSEQREQAVSYRYAIDATTALEPWQACTRTLRDYYSTNATNTAISATTECFDFDPTDPCCDSTLSWRECCSPRDVETSLPRFVELSDAFLSQLECGECAQSQVRSFADTKFSEARGACDNGALVPLTSLRTFGSYLFCRERYFGGSGITGVPCNVDDDCSAANEVAQRCSVAQGVCVQDRQAAETAFMYCLDGVLPSNVRIALIEQNQWEINEENDFASYMIREFASTESCVSRSYPTGLGAQHVRSYTPFPGCPNPVQGGAAWVSDMSGLVPPWAEFRLPAGGSCSYQWRLEGEVSQDVCQQLGVGCNVDSSITDEATCSGGGASFCGFCDEPGNPDSCVHFAGITSQAACEAAVGCALADGTFTTTTSAAECESLNRCTYSTGTSQCNPSNEQSCVANCGECIDTEQVFSAIEATSFVPSLVNGYCLFPILPYFAPDCTILYGAQSFPTSQGCVVFADCVSAGLSNVCSYALGTRTECQGAGGTWVDRVPANGEAECEAVQLCDAPAFGVSTMSDTAPSARTPKDPLNCAQCGGEVRPVNLWQSGRWLGGQSRQLSWMPRQLEARYVREPALDSIKLNLALRDAISFATGPQLLNNVQCTYGSVKRQIERVTCDCLTDNSDDACYTDEDLLLGLGLLCPNQENLVQAPPVSLTTTPDSLDDSVANFCIDFSITLLSSSRFDPLPIPTVATGFVELKDQPETGSYESVQNSNAVVGQVIGDGVEIEFENGSEADLVRELYVCMTVSPEIEQLIDQYPMLDFGEVSDETGSSLVVRPLAVPNVIANADGSICAVVNVPDKSSFSLVPIRRQVDYDQQSDPRLTNGQEALLYVVATMYVLLAVFITVQVIRLVSLGAYSLRQATNLLWLLFLLMTVLRSIYFYLVPANVLGQPDEHELVDFFFIHFPMVVYMMGNLIVGFSFLFLKLRQQNVKMRNPVYFWGVWSFVSLLIILMFVAVLLAFRYTVLDDQGNVGTSICPDINDNSDQAREIRIIFEGLIFGIACIIALVEAIFGFTIWHNAEGSATAITILRLTIIASIGMFSDSLAFLIYYIVDDPHPYFAIVLIFTEIIPIAFMVFVLTRDQISNAKHGGSSFSAGSSSSAM